MVLIWILPIYALDLDNTTSNLSVNSTRDQNQTHAHPDVDQNLYMVLKYTSAGKYKDMQDLHLRVLQILEGMRLLGRQNNSIPSVRYYTELENESAELERIKRSMIRC